MLSRLHRAFTFTDAELARTRSPWLATGLLAGIIVTSGTPLLVGSGHEPTVAASTSHGQQVPSGWTSATPFSHPRCLINAADSVMACPGGVARLSPAALRGVGAELPHPLPIIVGQRAWSRWWHRVSWSWARALAGEDGKTAREWRVCVIRVADTTRVMCPDGTSWSS